MDAFDRFQEWGEKPLDNPLTIPAQLHRAVMELWRTGGTAEVNQAAARTVSD
ncbi:hypothetical protein [Bradyrhizobium ottawaense]|uniref:hypothetical protein n=1 Tax=Bradyrhizobium ottawaense TaxID=931866 RepID=UPI003FA1666F